MRKNSIKKCLLVLAVLGLVLLSDSAAQQASALTLSSITSESIKEKEEQIRQAQDEKNPCRTV